MDFFDLFNPNWHIFHDSNLAGIQEFLVGEGNPNKQFYGGSSVFHDAINIPYDNIRVVEELINAGADVNLRTHLDFTPLHFAVSYRKQQVVEALIKSGASVNAKDFLGRTSLHLAVTPLVVSTPYMTIQMFPDAAIINNLLQHEDIDSNAMDSAGNTPLMLAVMHRQTQAATQLLLNRADPNICNNAFETPLHVAFSLPPNYIEIQLLKSGANINSVDKSGQTPLDILLKSGLTNRPNKWTSSILKIIAFQYNITSNLKQNLEVIPQLSQIFNKFCDEVDHMKSDFISGNMTMHDFCSDCFNVKDFTYQVEHMRWDFISGNFTLPGVCWDCFKVNDFEYHQMQIYKPVVERLVRDHYPEYFLTILNKIPKFNLFSILEMTAYTKKIREDKEKVESPVELFSLLDIIYLFSKYLSNVDFFCLIVAFSDEIIVESMQTLHARNSFY